MSGIDLYKPALGIATKAYVRFRAILPDEDGDDSPYPTKRPLKVMGVHRVTIKRGTEPRDILDTFDSEQSFFNILERKDSNRKVYEHVVKPMISSIMDGKTCNVFLYGCTGSGKTYTLLGDGPSPSKNQGKDGLGIFWAAAEELFNTCYKINSENQKILQKDKNQKNPKNQKTDIPVLQVVVRVNTIVEETSVDRLHPFPLERYSHDDNGTHPEQFLPATTILYGGYSRFTEMLVEKLKDPLPLEAPYSDARHHHSVFELEVTTAELLKDYEKVREIEGELSATQQSIRKLQHDLSTNPLNYTKQAELAEQEKEEPRLKADFETFKTAFRSKVSKFKEFSSTHKCIGGRIMFVDLAGAEFGLPSAANSGGDLGHSTVYAHGRLFNALANRGSDEQSQILRKSVFTNLLREQIEASNEGMSAMICTVRSKELHYYVTRAIIAEVNMLGCLAKPQDPEHRAYRAKVTALATLGS